MGRYLDLIADLGLDDAGPGESSGTAGAVPATPELPPRPAAREGIIAELVLRDGDWIWRERHTDDVDHAWLAYHEPPVAGDAARPAEASAIARAAVWRTRWAVNGYPPGVRPVSEADSGAGV